jgi:hypothetical protein
VVAFPGLTGGSTFTELFAGTSQPPTSLATYVGVGASSGRRSPTTTSW